MWLLIGMSVLLCENAGSDNTAPVIKVKENGTASLPCGASPPVLNVTWSRDTAGQKQKILSVLDGRDQDIKYITDTGRRYGTAADYNLTITRVSHSDSGIYDCNGIPVQLQVITEAEADLGQETTKAGILKKPGTAAGTASEKGEGRGDKSKRQQTKTEEQNKDDKHRKGGRGQGSGQNDRRKESQRTQKSTETVKDGNEEESEEEHNQEGGSSTAVTKTSITITSPTTTSPTTTSTERTQETAKDGDQEESEDDYEQEGGWWQVVVAVVSVCMVALAIVLWKCCLRRRAARGKGNAQEANHIYETVEERGRETAKHGIEKPREPVYALAENPQASRDDGNKKAAENVYCLAQNPGTSPNSGIKKSAENVYCLAQNPGTSADKGPPKTNEPVYSLAQNPRTTGDAGTEAEPTAVIIATQIA